MNTGIFATLLERLANLPRAQKRAVVFVLDLVLLWQSAWIGYSLRIGDLVYWNDGIRNLLIGATLVMVPVFYGVGVYNAIFRYVGVGMMRQLGRTFLIYGTAMVLLYSFWSIAGVPRTLGLLQPIIFFLLIGGARVLGRFLIVDLMLRHRYGGDVRRVLVYGAGSAGQQLASSIRAEPEMRVMGFIDDDQRLDGQKLDGDRIYWSKHLADVLERTEATDILLALPSVGRSRQRDIVKQLGKFSVRVKTLPQMKHIVDGKVSINDTRPIEIEDLLGREPVAPDELLLSRTIVGKIVLVSGAGGSIGSELCRQILAIGARKIVLLEQSEFSLYEIEAELRRRAVETGRVGLQIVAALGSVTDQERLAELFGEHAPDTVYHAAAYKHVPLVEKNPLEAIRNNVAGTTRMVEAAVAAKVSDFILVSTDKAVRPTNVMGATKRAAEQVLQSFAARHTATRFSMVRFGNVLGSSGSVVPLFRQQMEAGGPITLTHRDITRYFMTIPEAATLVIQAGGLTKGGEVFVLDMGKPVKISNLARTMIHLSGLTVRDDRHPDGDIAIVEVGLRPGEKLYEELLIGEKPEKTRHKRIMMAREDFLPWKTLSRLLDDLEKCRDRDRAIVLLKNIVPEFDHRRDNLPVKQAS